MLLDWSFNCSSFADTFLLPSALPIAIHILVPKGNTHVFARYSPCKMDVRSFFFSVTVIQSAHPPMPCTVLENDDTVFTFSSSSLRSGSRWLPPIGHAAGQIFYQRGKLWIIHVIVVFAHDYSWHLPTSLRNNNPVTMLIAYLYKSYFGGVYGAGSDTSPRTFYSLRNFCVHKMARV